jgi:hypothetical protein
MENTKSYATGLAGLQAEIRCETLPFFDHNDLESVRRVFQSFEPFPLQQAWLPKTQAGFSPGEVRLGWRGRSLMIFAELTDMDVFNDATGFNQYTWELGDVFEMFFQFAEMESYVEFHVTPNNQHLQLHYPTAGAAEWARKNERLTDFMIWNEEFHSKTWIESQMYRWYVFAVIPARAVCGSNESIKNTRWRFSFSRYDYTRGVKEPVISSTSCHAKPDFHRQHEWGVLIFKTHL